MNFCIGEGYDVHCLVPKRKLILGGVEIPFKKGLMGHSDADVLVHAIMDSLLGALGEGDIGKHFPDNNNKLRGISSLKLLSSVLVIINKHRFSIGNIDATLVAQAPKLSPYIPDMIANISNILNIKTNQINIKATTTEGLGFEGRGEGISARSICLLFKKN